MRVMLLVPPGRELEVVTLAKGIAASADLLLLDGPPSQAQEMPLPRNWLFCVALADPAEAQGLDAALEALSSPLDLVLHMDLPQEGLATRLTDPHGGCGAVAGHYRARGVLRRLRGEGGLQHRIRAALRILRDLDDARLSPQEDPFAQILSALERPPLVSMSSEPAPSQPMTAGHPEARHAPPTGMPRWKATAREKERLRRRPSGPHPRGGGRKPRI